MRRLSVFVDLWLVLLVLAISACDIFIPIPMPAPSSIPAFHPTATPTATSLPTVTPLPTTTPTPTPYFTATPAPCDKASLISDVLSPSGPILTPSTYFTSSWRLRNESPCTWTPGYWLVNAGGNDLGGPQSMRIPYLVFPGGELNLSVDLVAPCDNGTYNNYWMLRDEDGTNFGIGSSHTAPLLVHIIVAGKPVKPTCAGSHSIK